MCYPTADFKEPSSTVSMEGDKRDGASGRPITEPNAILAEDSKPSAAAAGTDAYVVPSAAPLEISSNQALFARGASVVSNESSTGRSSSSTAGEKSPLVQERENFLIFVKILFRVVDQPDRRARAKHAVMECRRRNVQGDPEYASLTDSCVRRLRPLVGEDAWQKAHAYLHYYCQKKLAARQSMEALSANPPSTTCEV